MGRPPKSDEEKKASGWPGKRKRKNRPEVAPAAVPSAAPAPQSPAEPKAAQDAAAAPAQNETKTPSLRDPPAALLKTRGGIAAQKWREYLPMMIETGITAKSDLETLRLLCLTLDRIEICQTIINEHGLTEMVVSKHGSRSATRKEIGILETAERNVLSYMEALGLTSSSRMRLTALGLKSKQMNLFDQPPGAASTPATQEVKQDAPAAAAPGNDANDPTGYVKRVH